MNCSKIKKIYKKKICDNYLRSLRLCYVLPLFKLRIYLANELTVKVSDPKSINITIKHLGIKIQIYKKKNINKCFSLINFLSATIKWEATDHSVAQ